MKPRCPGTLLAAMAALLIAPLSVSAARDDLAEDAPASDPGTLIAPAADEPARGPALRFEAEAGILWLIREEVENGLHQAGSGDEADDSASGFDLRRGRLGLTFASADGELELVLRLRLEERADILDCFGVWNCTPRLAIMFGQMKIPSLAENLRPDRSRDFTYPSLLAGRIADLALTRTPYISPIMAAGSHDRDLGIAARASLPAGSGELDCFLMLGNGLGAGKFVGGDSGEFLYSNGIGDFFYGGRLEWRGDRLRCGVHGSINSHQDVSLGDRGPVYDIDRRVFGCDAELRLPAGLRIGAFHGRGDLDDYWASTRYVYEMTGSGAQVIESLRAGKLEFCLRWDRLRDLFPGRGGEAELRHLTLGVNLSPRPDLRFQLNYVNKVMDNDAYEDVADDILSLYVQLLFDSVR